jgi:hypothetical protein
MQSTEGRPPDHSECPSVEVALHTEHDGFPLLNSLLLIGPLTRKLYGCLYSLGASVHWQHHVIPEEGGELLSEGPKGRIIKRPRREGQFGGLFRQGFHKPWVAMALTVRD